MSGPFSSRVLTSSNECTQHKKKRIGDGRDDDEEHGDTSLLVC